MELLYHSFQEDSTYFTKQKGRLAPVLFCYPHDEEFYTHATIIYHLAIEYNGYNNKSAYAVHKRF